MRKLAAEVRYETPRIAPGAAFEPTNRLTVSIATAGLTSRRAYLLACAVALAEA